MHRRRARPRPVRPAVVALAAALTLGVGALGACSEPTTGSPADSLGRATAGSGTSAATSTGAAVPAADEVLSRAKAAVESASSFHVSGTVDDAGKPVTVDVAGRIDGSSAQGSVRSADSALEFILVGGQTYIRGDARFWAQAGASATRAAQLSASRKWVKASAAEATSFTRLANPRALLGDLLTAPGTSTQGQKVEATTVGGAQCWGVSDRTGAHDTELDVLTSSFLPVRLVVGEGQVLSFDRWNAVAAPTAPAASQVISG